MIILYEVPTWYPFCYEDCLYFHAAVEFRGKAWEYAEYILIEGKTPEQMLEEFTRRANRSYSRLVKLLVSAWRPERHSNLEA